MCNILTYYFTCHHTLRRLRSRCSGTKHRPATSSAPAKAACTALSYLCICLRMECGTCQHQAWDDAWKLKLGRAYIFLSKLQRKGMPGQEEIVKLVRDLEEAHMVEIWNTRNSFANVPKPRIARVQHTRYVKAASKLREEVRPEDVVVKMEGKDWSELIEADYDGNYVASTDPLHPVNTTYDTLWAQSYPGGSEDEQSSEDKGEGEEGATWDANESGWDWGDGADDTKNEALPTKARWQAEESTPDDLDRTASSTIEESKTGFTAWGPEAKLSTSTSMLRIHDSDTAREHDERAAQVQEIIQAFWSIINTNANTLLPLPRLQQTESRSDMTSDDISTSSCARSHHTEGH